MNRNRANLHRASGLYEVAGRFAGCMTSFGLDNERISKSAGNRGERRRRGLLIGRAI